eukprot:scaffold492088_cov53-Prasinocladus_malaysianus.AAC.1
MPVVHRHFTGDAAVSMNAIKSNELGEIKARVAHIVQELILKGIGNHHCHDENQHLRRHQTALDG